MDNDPQLNGKYLGTISSDFVKISENLQEASYQIRKRGFSEYPIFPVSKEELPVGQPLIRKGELETQWHYNATYVDEFVQREIIDKDKLEDFKKTYKNPEEFCCLFVMDKAFTNFVFIPYPAE